MKICFENNIGSVVFGKGGEFNIIEIAGLDFQPKLRNMTTFAGSEGEYCLGESASARVITIKGDIKTNVRLIKNAVRVFGENGILRIRKGNIERRINAVCTSFEISDRGTAYKSFIIQFTADCPYFEDATENRINLFSKTKLIRSPFVLPMVLTRRESRADIYNSGDIKCEPIFEIRSHSDNGSGGVVLENLTTGARLTLEHTLKKNEVLTVDILNRTIISDLTGEVLASLSDDSFLSDFLFEKGRNTILTTNRSGGEISVMCRFRNRYSECVVR